MKSWKRWNRAFGATLTTALVCTSVNFPVYIQAAVEDQGSVPAAVTEEIPQAVGTVYHVDSENGSDESGDGSEAKPFKTLAKVNAIELQPGDGISLKKGSIFDNQQLAPKGTGTQEKPIVIDTYGEGSMPVINAGGFRRTGNMIDSDIPGVKVPEYAGYKEAVLIQNMEYTYVTGLEVTNDDAFNETSDAADENNLNSGSDDVVPRRLGIHVTIDERETVNKTLEDDKEYNTIVIDGCYVHDVDGNENRGVNKVDGGIGVEVIFSSKAGVYPYFNGVTIQNNRIDQCDRTGIKAIRLSDLDQFKNNDPNKTGYDPNNDADNNSANDGVRHDNIRYKGQAQRGLHIVGNYLSDIGGDGILVCEAQGAVVEHNVVNGQAMRAKGANAGIWAWNSFDTLFRYNESFDGPAYNQDGCSYDSDYWCAGTIFEYNYSHDTPMGFMLMMGNNNTDVIRYNVSQNDGLAWRHGAGNTNSASYIYNNVFYYDGANWVFNHSNGGGSAMGSAYNWHMYNNIYYNYNEEVTSKWGSADTTADSWKNSYLQQAGNLVYEASGIHDPGEIPNAIQADPLFENPGGGQSAVISEDGMSAVSDWESLKAYALKEGSPAIGNGVYVNVVPATSPENKGLWDYTSDRNAKTDFFGNPLYDGAPDIGIMEMTGVKGADFSLESNAGYKVYDPECGEYLASGEDGLEVNASGSQFVMENAGGGYKVKIWDTESNAYLYLNIDGGAAVLTEKDSTVWTAVDMLNGLHQLKSGDDFLVCNNDGTLSLGAAGTDWKFILQEHSKSYNVGGDAIDGFSADQAYDANKKLSGYVDEYSGLTSSRSGVYATGVTADTIEYKVYASDASHNLKLYVSEMEDIKGRTFDVLVNGEVVKERYTLSGDTDVIEIGSVYPAGGVIRIKLQSAYSEEAGTMTNPILNGIAADMAVMSEVNMRLDAGNSDTSNMGNHDGLFEDAEFEVTGSGWYANGSTGTEEINSSLSGQKPVPDAGLGTALKSGRAGEDFGYKFKAAPGIYRVKLYFNDTSADDFTPGTFDVSVNGSVVEEGFTIPEQDKAYDITVTAEAKDGLIDIGLKASEGKAIVNAVIVEPYQEITGENLALNKPAEASGQEADSMAAKYAVDGSQSTRYSSGQGSGQWISIDLEKKYMVDTVAVDWTPGAYATDYEVQVSADGNSWNTVKTVNSAYPGLNLVKFDPAEAQYVAIVSISNANEWGMSMTELGVYGEEITGSPAATVSTEDKGNHDYQVNVGLENIFNKYRNAVVEYTYDPAQITLNTDSAALNEEALLKTSEPTVTDNEDGTKTVRFSYGIKKQDAFKKAAELMNVTFTAEEGATRKPVTVNVSFSNAEGHVTALEKVITYVPNNFTHEDLGALIQDAEAQLNAAVVGPKPGEYTQEAVDTFKAAIDEAKAVPDGKEAAEYEAAYVKLEAAMKAFTEAVNVAEYDTYYQDFAIADEANFEYTNASGQLTDEGMLLSIGGNGTAKDMNASAINQGIFRIRFTTDSIADQTLFTVGSGIMFGYDAGGGNWFYDKTAENGWGDFTKGYPLTENKEHEIIFKFVPSAGKAVGLYDLTLWYDGTELGSASNVPYSTEPGQYTLQTRRAAHGITVKEVYYGDEVPTHTISVTAGENGTVSQTGDVSVDRETNKTFVIKPNKGYTVDKVLVDGKPAVVDNNKVTFEYVIEDHTLEVTFKKLETSSLEALIKEMKGIEADGYTPDSYQTFQEAIAAAEAVVENAVSQKEITDAIVALGNAKDVLVPITLEAITVNTENAKTDYLLGDEFDAEGIVVEAVYNDGNTKPLNADEYTITGFDSSVIGPKEITVTYTEGETVLTASFTVQVKLTVDTKGLELAITMAENLANGSQSFSPESWAAVEEALTEANEILTSLETTQGQVDDAFSKLISAITSLKPGVQKFGLEAAVQGAEAILADPATEERYTEGSVQAVKDTLKAAKTVLDTEYGEDEVEAGQTAVNEATTNLLTAVSQMLDKDFARLHAVIAQAETILKDSGKYTAESVERLKNQLETARQTAANTELTGQEAREARQALEEAITGLVFKGNKAALETVMAKAQEILDNSGRYLAGSIEGLQEALDKAKIVYDDLEAVQDEINAAVAELTKEVEEVRLLGDVDLNGVVNAADSALLLQYSVGLKELTEEQILIGDVNADNETNTTDATRILQMAAEKITTF